MINRLMAALLVFATAAAVTESSNAEPKGEPQYIGVIAARNTTTKEWIQLDRTTPTQETRVIGLGFGGAVAQNVYPGDSASVRLKSDQPLEFVIRVERQDRDPQGLIQFFRLDVVKGRRVLPQFRARMFSGGNSDAAAQHRVAFTADKLGSNFFVFKPTQPLTPGEYSLSATDVADGFNFGIDP
jgi:hypothetical protein